MGPAQHKILINDIINLVRSTITKKTRKTGYISIRIDKTATQLRQRTRQGYTRKGVRKRTSSLQLNEELNDQKAPNDERNGKNDG